jgi:hypothetical protein
MEDFDWKRYINYYDDLTIFDKNFAINHWLIHGIHENRIFFKKSENQVNENEEENLDWVTYTSFYEDLNSFGQNEAIHHWKTHGIRENRIFFHRDDRLSYRDWNKYREYDDLKNFSDKECIIHWLYNGKSENRKESFIESDITDSYIIPNNNVSNYKYGISTFYPS